MVGSPKTLPEYAELMGFRPLTRRIATVAVSALRPLRPLGRPGSHGRRAFLNDAGQRPVSGFHEQTSGEPLGAEPGNEQAGREPVDVVDAPVGVDAVGLLPLPGSRTRTAPTRRRHAGTTNRLS